MNVHLNAEGKLTIIAQTELEAYALNTWFGYYTEHDDNPNASLEVATYKEDNDEFISKKLVTNTGEMPSSSLRKVLIFTKRGNAFVGHPSEFIWEISGDNPITEYVTLDD